MTNMLSLAATPLQKKFLKYYTPQEDGSVLSHKTGRPLKGHITNMGYRAIAIRIKGEKKQFTVHRIIAQAFIPIQIIYL